MARFDVYVNPENSERRYTPYLLDVQNNYIDALASRVVIPLRREDQFGPAARHLDPLVKAVDVPLVLDTAAIGAVPLSELRKSVANLRNEQAVIQEALDTLFGAY